MVTNKTRSSLRLKKDFLELEKKGLSFCYKWIKGRFLPGTQDLRVAWSLSRRNLQRALDRNRFKRYGREFIKNSSLKGDLRIYFLKKEKFFYTQLRRKEFNVVFEKFIQKIEEKQN